MRDKLAGSDIRSYREPAEEDTAGSAFSAFEGSRQLTLSSLRKSWEPGLCAALCSPSSKIKVNIPKIAFLGFLPLGRCQYYLDKDDTVYQSGCSGCQAHEALLGWLK